MGNKLGRRRQVVDENYTRPQGLYQIKDVDCKKLRKLILESKLAPCYPGGDECDCGLLEECPICFLYYPTLNRSRCCTKGICTECFLQMKNPSSTRPTQCPFCKTANYAVEYRGEKSKEERGLEQLEEQKVLEAKIRMRQQELQKDEEKVSTRQEVSSSSAVSQVDTFGCSRSAGVESEEVVPSQEWNAAQLPRKAQHRRHHRNDDFDLDLEDIMVMEAIWLSIQENGRPRHQPEEDATPENYPNICYVSHSQLATPIAGPGSSSLSPSSGFACAIASLAERQQMSGESPGNYSGNHTTSFDMVAACSSRSTSSRAEQIQAKYPPAQPQRSSDDADWSVDNGSVIAGAGTSYGSSDDLDDSDEVSALLPPPPFGMDGNCYGSLEETEGGHGGFTALLHQLPAPPAVAPYNAEGSFQSGAGPIIPESFEEQMMLAMALSLAEARARTSTQGVARQ